MFSLKKCRFIFFLILSSILLINLASAASIGISPGTLEFAKMLRSGYLERNVFITLSLTEPISVTAKVEGEIKEWVTLKPSTTFNVSKDSPQTLTIVVQPPNDIANGLYNGIVRITTSGLGEIKGSMGSVAIAAIDLPIQVEIVDYELTECRAFDFNVKNSEEGYPVKFSLNVVNDGNVQFKPNIAIDIWDQQHTSIVKTVKYDEKAILPSRTEEIDIEVDTDGLEIGQYWAEVTAEECLASDTLTFDLMEQGSLTTSGLLERIENKPWAKVNEVLPLTAIFRNTGERSVLAKFKGTVSLGDKIVEVVESESLNVPIDEPVNFTVFFKPTEAGRYVVSGRVFYDKKQTFESNSIINATPLTEEKKEGKIGTVVYLFLAFAIFILLYKIRKKKKRLYS